MSAAEYRKALGQHPTGVALITAIEPHGDPVGMVVGTFSSVSLEPRLVSFMPTKTSSTYSSIRKAGRFAVSVLSAEHAEVCAMFATKNAGRWTVTDWEPTPAGIPRLRDALVWLECEIVDVREAGDHDIVIGEVHHIDIGREGSPLVFFRGGYGQFTADSLVLRPETELMPQIRVADLARQEMEAIARETGYECVAQAIVGNELVLIASAPPPGADATGSHVGVRIPLVPPRGSLFAAWPPNDSPWKAWATGTSAETGLDRIIERVRTRGWSVWLAPEDPELDELFDAVASESYGSEEVEQISRAIDNLQAMVEPDQLTGRELEVRFVGAPVFGPDGAVLLVLRLLGLPTAMSASTLENLASQLVAAADRVTEFTGGRTPHGSDAPDTLERK